MKTNKVVITLIIIIVGVGSYYLMQPGVANSPSKENDLKLGTNELKPVDNITHGHGLAVDVTDLNNLYIATHHGLLLLKNDEDLYQVGDKKDDYMGFSPHPTDPKIFFSSGHPEAGGNIGFQKSVDGGLTWKKVSDGAGGPVDFHAMTVSPADPNLIFGWYQGAIQRSTDGGKNWEVISTTDFPIINLAADPKNKNIVYATSPQGLMMSENMGTDWIQLFDGFVSAIAVDPKNSQKLLSFTQKYNLAQSNNGGKTWETLSETFGGETPLFIAFNKQNSQVVYALTEKNSIYKSSDGGNSWDKIR